MGLILTTLTITLLSLLLAQLAENNDWSEIILGINLGIFIISICFLVGELCAIPMSRTSDRTFINKLEANRATLVQQRSANVNPLENVQISKEIMDINADLADRQYWANTFWLGIYYINDIKNVKPL